MLKFTILSENNVWKRDFIAEHGLSLYVEIDDFSVLFDTGQTGALLINAEKAGVDVAGVNALVLSHGHYDHTGAVPVFSRLNTQAPVYVHPGAFRDRYHSKQSTPIGKNIGVSWRYEEIVDRVVPIKKATSIHEKVTLSGEIPRKVPFEESPRNFLVRNGSGRLVEDIILDEQFMVVQGNRGIYIFVGCSHPGIINCVTYAKKLCPEKKVSAVIGGMHLHSAKDVRKEMTLLCLLDLGVETVIPLHCTGRMMTCEIKKRMQENCVLLATGDEYVLEE